MSKEQEHNDWLESFLQEQADKHRLYPSDQLWQNIQENIHGKKPWPALTLVALVVLVALTISTLLNNHPDKQAYILKLQENSLQQEIAGQTMQSPATNGKHYINQFSGADLTNQTLQIIREHNELEAILNHTAFAGQQAVVNVEEKQPTRLLQPTIAIAQITPYVDMIGEQMIQQEQAEQTERDEVSSELPEEAKDIAGNFRRSMKKAGAQEHDADDFLSEQGYKENPVIRKKGTPTKFSYQFWTSPSTGFRNLDEGQARILNATNNAASNSITSAVFNPGNNQPSIRHRPGLGLELGLALFYQVKPAFRIKAGIQFNLRHYLIEAFQSGYEQSDVILVRDDRTVQKLPVFTRINNKSGFTETVIDNKLYQLAFPVGFQLDIVKGKRLGVLIDASIQPTLNLNSKLYTLTTDLNHYFDGSNLIRRWNMNSTIGLNFSYTTANKVSWQIGPQFRYQHLPTYTNAYPIRENFKDFGVKLGMLIPIRH